MACELDKAIEYLLTVPAAKRTVQNIIDRDALVQKQYGDIIQKAYGVPSEKLSLTKFARDIRNLFKEVVKPSIDVSKEFTLGQIKFGMDEFIGGVFDTSTNNIAVSRNVTVDTVKGTLKSSLYEQFIEEIGGDDAAKVLTPAYVEKSLNSEVKRVLTLIDEARGPNLLLHELVHAGTAIQMDINSGSQPARRIEDMYNYLAENYQSLGMTDGYWRTNKEEFIAEALSNPKVMLELMSIAPSKPQKRLTNLYEVLLTTMLQSLGFRGTKLETMFDVVLDAQLAMLEEQGTNLETKQKQDTAPSILDGLSDEGFILGKETKQKEQDANPATDSKKQEPKQESIEPRERPEPVDATEDFGDQTTTEVIKERVKANEEYIALEEELVQLEKQLEEDTKLLTKSNTEAKAKGGFNALLVAQKKLKQLGSEIDAKIQSIATTNAKIKAVHARVANGSLVASQGTRDVAKLTAERKAQTASKNVSKEAKEEVVGEVRRGKARADKTSIRKKAKDDTRKAITSKKDEISTKGKELSSLATDVISEENAPQTVAGVENTSLSKFFSAKAVASNLTVLKDKLKEGFSKAVEFLPLKGVEATHLHEAKKLMDLTEAYIRKAYKETAEQGLVPARDVETVSGVEGFQNIAKLLGRDTLNEKELPPEVVTTIALAVNDWLVNAAGNRAHLRTDDDINRFLKQMEGTTITDAMRSQIADVDAFATDAANTIGASVIKSLGIAADTDKIGISEVLLEKLKTEIGLIAIQSMRHNRMISIKTKPVEEIFGKANTSAEDTGKTPNVIKFLKRGSGLVDTKGGAFSRATKTALDIMGIDSNVKRPRDSKKSKLTKFITKSPLGRFFSIPPKTQEALNKAENVEWGFNEDFQAGIEDMLSTQEGRDTLEEYMGYVEPGTVHKRNQKSVNGKNAAIRLNIEKLEAGFREHTGSMFFNYFFSKNGRFFIDSNTLNPQTSKLHRFSMHTDSIEVKTDEDVDMVNIGLAQSFGVDTDKMTTKSGLKAWKEVEAKLDDIGVSGMSITEAIQAITAYNKANPDSKIKGHDPEHLIAGIVEYTRLTDHLRQGNTIKGFTSKLPLEIDAVTSGYILKTLQMPLIDGVVNHLEGGGVFVADENGKFKYQSFGEQAEADTLDAYQKPAKVMLAKAKAMGKKLGKTAPMTVAAELATKSDFDKLDTKSGKISKEMRNFMKNPFMVFNYGSGMTSIVNAMTDSGVNNFYDLVVSTKPEDQARVETITMSMSTGMKNIKGKWVPAKGNRSNEAREAVTRYKGMTADQRLEFEVSKELENNLRSNTKAGIGVALEETFTETYQVYIDAGKKVNDSFRVMFRLFKAKMDAQTDAKQKELGRHLTEAETDVILESLTKSMPSIKTALAEGESDRLVIINTESGLYEALDGADVQVTGQGKFRMSTTVGTDAEIAEAQEAVRKAPPKGKKAAQDKVNRLKKQDALSAQAKRRNLVEAYAAGAVIPIHYIDGALMSETVATTDSLGVHDALMTLIDAAVKDGKTYNQAMAELAASYSLPTEILSSLNLSINEATPEEIAAVNKAYADEAGDGENVNVPTVADIVADMGTLQAESEAARVEVLSNPIRYEHMAIEGGHFDWNTEGNPYVAQEPSVKLNEDKAPVTTETTEAAEEIAVTEEVVVAPVKPTKKSTPEPRVEEISTTTKTTKYPKGRKFIVKDNKGNNLEGTYVALPFNYDGIAVKTDTSRWTVSEITSGAIAGQGSSRAAAVADAERAMTTAGEVRMAKMVASFVDAAKEANEADTYTAMLDNSTETAKMLGNIEIKGMTSKNVGEYIARTVSKMKKCQGK